MPPEKTKATIYDVAERAGVAISTVSRVLNASHDVSEATRKRVQAAIEALQFRPDRTAKMLAQKRVHTVSVAVPTFTTPFHTELLKGVRSAIAGRNVDVLLSDLGSSDTMGALRDFLRRGAVSGLLVVGVPVDEAIASELGALQAPVVLMGGRWDAFDSFYWDDVAGAETAVAHLIERGHRRIAMIRSQFESVLLGHRVQGYRQALAAADIPYDDALVVTGTTAKHAGFSEEAGAEAVEALLETGADFTAVYCSSDVHAVGAMHALREAGLRVPEDVAVVGYDDVKTSRYIGLSSVDQGMQRIGHEGTALLLERMRGRGPDARVSRLVTPELRIRASSEPYRNPSATT